MAFHDDCMGDKVRVASDLEAGSEQSLNNGRCQLGPFSKSPLRRARRLLVLVFSGCHLCGRGG